MELFFVGIAAAIIGTALYRGFKGKVWKPRVNIDPSLNVGRRRDDDIGGEEGG